MARILDIFLSKKPKTACWKYPDNRALFDGLEQEAPEALQCLASKVSAGIFKLAKSFQLPDEDIEELICDAITIFLQKIRNGQYLFQGYDPGSFVIEIAKKRALNFRRSVLRNRTRDLEEQLSEPEETYFADFEAVELLESMLNQLPDNCRNLIRLKYLEGYSDKAIIEAQLTQYTTTDALKNHRSKCMKKLVEIGKAYFPN